MPTKKWTHQQVWNDLVYWTAVNPRSQFGEATPTVYEMAKRWGWKLAEIRDLGRKDHRVWVALSILHENENRFGHYMKVVA